MLLRDKYVRGPRTITTQLCVGVAGLALQLPQWTDAFIRMMDMFGSKQDDNCRVIFIEFLIVLPEEVRSLPSPAKGAAPDFAVTRAAELITNRAGEVVQYLLGVMQASTNTDVHTKALQCLVSWIRSNDIGFVHFSTAPILQIALQAMQLEDLFEPATDVLCELVRECNSIDPTSPFIDQLCQGLASLAPMIEASMDDEDKQRDLCRIFAETGETFLMHIVETPARFEAVLSGILRCTAFTDLDVVQITFEFWFSLTDSVKYDPSPAFVAIYRALFDTMMRHLRFPDDDTTLTAKERDDFRSFRHEMGNVMKDCFLILGEQESLSRPLTMLQTFLSNNSTPWQDIEAVLFSFRALGAEVSNHEQVYIPQLMQMMATLPKHPKLQYASILVYGRYACWTSEHPDTIPFQLQLICAGFENAEVTAASAQTFMYLCESCGSSMTLFLTDLYPFYMSLSAKLGVDEMVEVSAAIAHIVKHVPIAHLPQVLLQYITPALKKIRDCLASYSQSSDKNSIVKTIDAQLLQLNMFFKLVSPNDIAGSEHPCIAVFKECIPLIDSLLKTCKEESIGELTSKIFKSCIHSFDRHCEPILPWMLQTIGSTYHDCGYSCYTWIMGHVLRILGKQMGNDNRAVMIQMIKSMNMDTVQKMQTSAIMDSHPDVVDDYCGMMLSAISHQPDAVFNQDSFVHILQLCLIGLSATHNLVVGCCSGLLRDILALGSSVEIADSTPSQMLRPVLPDFIPPFIKVVVKRIVGPDSVIPYQGDLFPSLARMMCSMVDLSSIQVVVNSASSALDAVRAEDPRLSEEGKNAFLQALYT